MPDPLLNIQNLSTHYQMSYGTRRAVEAVNLKIYPTEKVGLAGESGCGKSTIAMNILRILPKYAVNPQGSINFKGEDLLTLDNNAMRQIRGKEISMVFQEPMTALSPVHKIGKQIIDVIQTHCEKSRDESTTQAIEYLSMVKIPNPKEIMHTYPHQLSGGMRQRVMIAMALACDPDLLILDEPTSALDTVIQMELIKLLEELKQNLQTTVLLITHNLHLIHKLCDKVGIMYLGRIVEFGPIKDVFESSKHPYTQGLIKSIPKLTGPIQQFYTIQGEVPDSMFTPPGCSFHPRCPYVMPICRETMPGEYQIKEGHSVACYLFDENIPSAQKKN